MDKSFERTYSINVARLKPGAHEDSFLLDSDFFSHFAGSLIEKGNVRANLDLIRYGTHLDVTFRFEGHIWLPCDRCGEEYSHAIRQQERIIYAFDEEMKFEGYEVMFVDRMEPALSIVQELYDFLTISVPLRRVPAREVHICNPEILALLGLDPEGNELVREKKEDEIDPRWEKLKKLKDQQE
ncbi:MAG: DUF177 domain-containing protein [Bacteroidetes bacterium]|nr:MAG: DUF177 domain-containing protein [Bacteroidota bacterium]